MVLEGESTEWARRLLGTLPLVKAGFLDFELIPLGPFPFEEVFS
jgi:hypothetical protein